MRRRVKFVTEQQAGRFWTPPLYAHLVECAALAERQIDASAADAGCAPHAPSGRNQSDIASCGLLKLRHRLRLLLGCLAAEQPTALLR